MNPERDIQQVSDVLRTGTSRARSSKSRIVQTREGPVPGGFWQCRRGSQVRITVGRWTKVGGRKELLSPTHVLLLIEGEHGGNEPSGGFPVGANSCGASRAVASLRGVRRTTGFASLARLALEQELLLSTLQERLKALLLPKGETLLNLSGHAQALGHRGEQELRAALLQLSIVVTPLSHAVPAPCHGADHAQTAAGRDVQHGAGGKCADRAA